MIHPNKMLDEDDAEVYNLLVFGHKTTCSPHSEKFICPEAIKLGGRALQGITLFAV
jgi:hypothetical protein